MRALIQRVSRAEVRVDDVRIAAIDAGLLALIGIQPDDDGSACRRMLERLLAYRVFADADGRMNRSLRDSGGGLLLVSQFTLAADTSSGLRPGFSTAANPELAKTLFEELLAIAVRAHPVVAAGRFGAHMAVELVNDGPVTLLLEV